MARETAESAIIPVWAWFVGAPPLYSLHKMAAEKQAKESELYLGFDFSTQQVRQLAHNTCIYHTSEPIATAIVYVYQTAEVHSPDRALS